MTENTKPTIFVDMRESRSPILAALKAMPEIVVEVCALSSGDYQIREDIIIERKAASDFILSIMDQRLFAQVKKMKLEYARPIVLIEGDVYKTRSAIPPASISGAISYLVAIENLTVLNVANSSESASVISTMCRHSNFGLGYEPPIRASKPKASLESARYLLEGLVGVGPKTAAALIAHFGSARSVFNANVDDLTKVPGIGKKTAERIVESLIWESGGR